ncbi:33 kDa chaperonin [bioreactor metagenome]|uniref:33 kDa chaperonin n=1 Tax=bioreactor metagenome TaxID=1076179 RepID=A0A645BE97_9ZZZZ
MYVIKDMGFGEPYIGMSRLVSGEIAEDITQYFASSEQTPSVCALGVLVGRDRSVAAAGGFIIQLLPGADDSTADIVEKNISSLKPVTQLISEGKTNTEIAELALAGMEFDIFDEIEVDYICDCSKERYAAALGSLGNDELLEMRAENKPQTAECYFCGAKYVFEPDELDAIIKALKNDGEIKAKMENNDNAD